MTGENVLPPRARELLHTSIHSIEALEVLLMLRAAADRRFSSEELARELALPESLVVAALPAMVSGKLATEIGAGSPPRYQYAPHTPEARAAVDELADGYAHNRLDVLSLLSTNAIARVRKGALKTFSDSFRLRDRKKDG